MTCPALPLSQQCAPSRRPSSPHFMLQWLSTWPILVRPTGLRTSTVAYRMDPIKFLLCNLNLVGEIITDQIILPVRWSRITKSPPGRWSLPNVPSYHSYHWLTPPMRGPLIKCPSTWENHLSIMPLMWGDTAVIRALELRSRSVERVRIKTYEEGRVSRLKIASWGWT